MTSGISTLEQKKDYIAATEVGTAVGYTKDYILMLIKQDKIDGKKIGHKWYATLKSAETYFENAKKEQEGKRKRLSAIRKAELVFREKKQNSSVLESVKGDVVQSQKEASRVNETSLKEKYTTSSVDNTPSIKVAVLETLLIIFLGVSTGSLGYLGLKSESFIGTQTPSAFVQGVAREVYTFLSVPVSHNSVLTASLGDISEVSPTSSVGEKSDFVASDTVDTAPQEDTFFQSDEIHTEVSVEQSIQQMFSDTVTVIEGVGSENEVIITPHFIDGPGQPQTFMIVPLEESRSQIE